MQGVKIQEGERKRVKPQIRILTADDEPHSRRHFRELLAAEAGFELISECCNGVEAVAQIRALQPDIALLDIEMPEMDGFAVAAAFKGEPRPILVFITSEEKFAARAFEFGAADYLLKPFGKERFAEALRRAARAVNMLGSPAPGEPAQPSGKIAISSQGRAHLIEMQEIDWISAADNYVEIHCGSSTHLLRKPLKELLQDFSATQFPRISRSTVVNVDRISEVRSKGHGDFMVILKTGERLTGTRTYRRNLLK